MKNAIRLLFLFMFMLCACTRYDHETPDTKDNRDGFRAHVGIDPDKVSNIYFFADEWLDAAYAFSFTAPPDVIEEIKAKFEMKESPMDTGFLSYKNAKWMNLEERQKSQYFEYHNEESEVYYGLWYNPSDNKCQIEMVYY